MVFAPDITLDQLTVLLAVVEHGSFTAAAKALRRTQGVVSYHLARLESQLELELFDRSGYRPVLTDAGQVVVREARAVLEGLHHLRAAASGIRGGLEARLVLALDVLFPPRRLARLHRRFQDAFPSVDLAIETGISGETAERIHDGEAQVGVVHAGAIHGLVSRPSAVLEFLLVVAPDHPLSQLGRPVSLEDLRRHPNLVLPTASRHEGLVRATDGGLRRWRVADSAMRHELLRAGAGWARVPRHQVEDDLTSGALVVPDVSRLPGATAQIALAVVTHPERPPGPAGQWWVDALAEKI